MNKIEKMLRVTVRYGTLILLGVLLVIFIVQKGIFHLTKGLLYYINIWAILIMVCYSGLVLLIVIWVIVNGIRKGWHHIKHCDIPIYEELDTYRKNYGNQQNAIKSSIEMINLYYKKNGKVDKEFVKKLDLQSLYIRYDFLEKDFNLCEDIKVVAVTLGLSVTYSILQIGINKSFFSSAEESTVGSILTILSIICVILILIFERTFQGQFNSFFHYVSKYEMELLNKKINKVESKIKIREEQEAVKKMQYWLMNSLYKYKDKKVKKKNEKMKIEKDIREIANLDLCKNVPKHTVMIPVDKDGEYKYYYMEKFSGPEIDSDVVFKSDQYKYYKIYSKYKTILENE